MPDYIFSYNDLCDVLFINGSLEQFIQDKYPQLINEQICEINSYIKKNFLSHFNQRWKLVHRTRTRFFEKYNVWMMDELKISIQRKRSKSPRGRRTKNF